MQYFMETHRSSIIMLSIIHIISCKIICYALVSFNTKTELIRLSTNKNNYRKVILWVFFYK